jgi:hypothetical protein
MPSDPGLMFGSVSETVPFVWMLFPLQPGYTITVWAEASDQLATTKTSSVNRNMVTGEDEKRCRSDANVLLFYEAAICKAVHNLIIINANRQRAVAGGHQHLWGARPGSKVPRATIPSPERGLLACEWNMQANEHCKTAPPGWPASACQLSKH